MRFWHGLMKATELIMTVHRMACSWMRWSGYNRMYCLLFNGKRWFFCWGVGIYRAISSRELSPCRVVGNSFHSLQARTGQNQTGQHCRRLKRLRGGQDKTSLLLSHPENPALLSYSTRSTALLEPCLPANSAQYLETPFKYSVNRF